MNMKTKTQTSFYRYKSPHNQSLYLFNNNKFYGMSNSIKKPQFVVPQFEYKGALQSYLLKDTNKYLNNNSNNLNTFSNIKDLRESSGEERYNLLTDPIHNNNINDLKKSKTKKKKVNKINKTNANFFLSNYKSHDNNNNLNNFNSQNLDTPTNLHKLHTLKSGNFFNHNAQTNSGSINNPNNLNANNTNMANNNSNNNNSSTNTNFHINNHTNRFLATTLPKITSGFTQENIQNTNINNFTSASLSRQNKIINIPSEGNINLAHKNNLSSSIDQKNRKQTYNSVNTVPNKCKTKMFYFRPLNNLTLTEILNEPYKFYQPAKHSENGFDQIAAYGVNTFRGTVRNYNEDRVSIIVNVKNNKNIKESDWPKISFFGIYDGHAGNKCSEYLKNNLHHFIFNTAEFPADPLVAISKGFKECENTYMRTIHTKFQVSDYSGSCALVCLIINDMCYCINLGDSRAIYSTDNGEHFIQLSRDHKPNDPIEKKRIYKAGGSIFKTSLAQCGLNITVKECDLGFKLPFRISPGRLSVARAFGDAEAKLSNLGGNPKVLIAEPVITSFRLTDKSDFILMGCDGIYDRLENNDILNMVWGFKKKGEIFHSIHLLCGNCADAVIKYSMKKLSVDNVTVIFIAFKNFEKVMLDEEFEYPQRDNFCQYIDNEIDLSLA